MSWEQIDSDIEKEKYLLKNNPFYHLKNPIDRDVRTNMNNLRLLKYEDERALSDTPIRPLTDVTKKKIEKAILTGKSKQKIGFFNFSLFFFIFLYFNRIVFMS